MISHSIVYDLDGVLVDTREANLRAYQEAGVQPPANFHQVFWDNWCSEPAHSLKNAMLPACLARYARPLPLLAAALASRSELRVLSSISPAALRAVRANFPELERATITAGLRSAEKVRMLCSMGARGVYYDDDPVTCVAARIALPGWQICEVR